MDSCGEGRSDAGRRSGDTAWWSVRTVTVALVLATVLAAGGQAAVDPGPTAQQADPAACVGTIERAAEGTTLISVQGAKGRDKRPARVVAVGPEGSIEWVHHSGQRDTLEAGSVIWSYDVDPLPSGEIFVTVTVPGDTVLYAFDPRSGEVTWQVHRPALDTHDADVLPNGNVAVANMANYDPRSGENRDRVYVLDPERNRTVWEWHFAERYPRSIGGPYTPPAPDERSDWTHVNDVDRVGSDRFLLSPRNFDQVLLVDRESGEIVWRLGRPGNHSILQKQHNPDYLAGADGRDTVLVADSENDRIVEYARADGDGAFLDGEWNRTWHLSGDFRWPRDADRLPNGNTLVTDSRNHRVLEVAPNGTVVWEVYTPWLPYDAERLGTGDGSNGPTAREQASPSEATVSGDDGGHANEDRLARCAAAYRNAPGPGDVEWTPGTGTRVDGETRPSDGATTARDPMPSDVSAEETASRTATVDATWSPVATLLALAGVSLLAGRRRRS
jgi:hypothetical protein